MEHEDKLDLSSIPGLGPVRRAALEEAGITDLHGLLSLTVAELAAVRGIGVWQARKIREFLRQRGLLVEREELEPGAHGGDEVILVAQFRTAEEAQAINQVVDAMAAQAAVEAELEDEVHLLAGAVAPGDDAGPPDPEQALAAEEAELLGQAAHLGANSMNGGGAAQALHTERDGSGDGAGLRVEGAGRGAGQEEARDVEDVEETDTARVSDADEDDYRDHGGAGVEKHETDAVGREGAAGGEAARGEADRAATGEVDEFLQRLGAQREQLPETALSLIRAIREAAVAPQLTRQITRLLITASEFVSDSRPLSEAQRRAAAEKLERAEQSLQGAIEKRSFGERSQRELARRIRRRRKELEELLEQE